jgi:L-asparagine transporter-like permease
MKKSRMPIAWIVGMMLVVLGNLIPYIGSHFYAELPTWVEMVRIVMVFGAIGFIAGSVPTFLKMRKESKEN